MFDVDETVTNYGYINFQPVGKEEWSIYHLVDETVIKLKVIPLKFLKKDGDISLNPLVLMVPFAPKELKGEPTPQLPTTPDEMMKQVKEADMKFDVIQEPWNEYKLELEGDVHYFIKTIAIIISSTKLYDSGREPVYLVNNQLLTKKHPMF